MVDGERTAGSHGRPRILAPLLLLCLAYAFVCAWNLADLVRRWDYHADDAGPDSLLFLTLRCVLTTGCATALLLLLWKGRSLRSTVRDLRLFACCLLLALVTASFAQPWLLEEEARWLTRTIFFCTLMVALLLLAARVLVRGGASPAAHAPWLSRLELVCVNLLLTLVIAEGIVIVWSVLRPTPLLFGRSVDARLDAMRRTGGQVFFDAQRNSGGYTDDEFIVAGPDDLVVAVIADSFGLGIVPMRHNFVSVAESLLRERLEQRYERIAIHNFGVPGVGLPEYARLLTTEVMATNPRLVFLCLFVGNDIHEGNTFGAPVRQRYSLQHWRVWSAIERLVKLLTISSEERAQLAATGGGGRYAGTVPDFIEDSSLEPPFFTPERFMEIELSRMEVANRHNPWMEKRYPRLRGGLRHFHQSLGDRLMVLLLPDEFQINDELYEEILQDKKDPENYVRDLPQQRIVAFCKEQGIPVLDLLPLLRSHTKAGGVRPYHLRDIHFNAMGNRITGEALGQFILAHRK